VSHGVAGLPNDHRKVIVQPTERDLIVGQDLVEGETSIAFARDGEESDDTVVMQLKDRILDQVQSLGDGRLHEDKVNKIDISKGSQEHTLNRRATHSLEIFSTKIKLTSSGTLN